MKKKKTINRRKKISKKKGFTLIEVLAVIIIIGIIAIIAVPMVSNYIEDASTTTYKSFEKSMEDSAKNKMIDCIDGKEGCLNLDKGDIEKVYLYELIDGGYIDNMKDPDSNEMCRTDLSYVLVERDYSDTYKYDVCLYCGEYQSENSVCTKATSDGDNPECGEISGNSTRWTNQDRNITVKCSDSTSGCTKGMFSKVFKTTTEKGEITISDKSGNTTVCGNIDVYVDKTEPTCEIEVKSGDCVDWLVENETCNIYENNVRVGIKNQSDLHSGILTYGMGTSILNRDYNKNDTMSLQTGITTVIGYVKDQAGNEGICTKDIKVATTPTVTLNSNGGVSCSPSSKTVVYGGTYGSLCTPTRSGHTFAGWYTLSSGGDKIESTTRVTRPINHTLYAHWEADTYVVTFNTNGGDAWTSGTCGNGLTLDGTTCKKEVMWGNTYGTLPTPTKTDYVFAGWYDTNASTGGNKIESSTIVNLTNDKVLYARWKLNGAIFLSGKEFSTKVKKLSGQSNATYSTINESIQSIVKSNTLDITPTMDNVVSIEDSAVPIYAWFNNGTIYYYSQAINIYLNSDASYMFYYMRGLADINLSNINTSKTTDMSYMFNSAGYNAATFNISSLSNWNTSNVTNMSYMFSDAGYGATTFNIGNLSSWNTLNVTNMSYMFYYAGYSATTFSIGSLANWNTLNVTDMRYMFYDAGRNATTWSIGSLANWNTLNVTDMSGMFGAAGYSATTFNIGSLANWNTSNVTNMSEMFRTAGRNATTFNIGNLSSWNTSNVTNMREMFMEAGYSAKTWSVGSLSSWSTSNVTDMSNMFWSAGRNATTFNIGNLSGWDTSNVTNMSYMFIDAGYNATTFNIGDLSSWNTSKVTKTNGMFSNAGHSAKTWNIGNLSNWDTSKVTDMSSMFYGAGYSATTFNIGSLSNWNTSNVESMEFMFASAGYSATTWNIGNLSNWNTSNVTTMGDMFMEAGYSTKTWTIGDLSSWNTSNVTNMGYMFREAGYNATTFNIGNLSNWNTLKVTDMGYMFGYAGYKAKTWTIGDLSSWNTSNVTNTGYMFREAGYNATTFNIGDLSDWDTSKVTNVSDMFREAGRNATTWGNIGTLKVYATEIKGMFESCPNAKATINIYSNPTSYSGTFSSAATKTNASIVVNYSSTTTNIDAIIKTKSSSSHVTKGSVIS